MEGPQCQEKERADCHELPEAAGDPGEGCWEATWPKSE